MLEFIAFIVIQRAEKAELEDAAFLSLALGVALLVCYQGLPLAAVAGTRDVAVTRAAA